MRYRSKASKVHDFVWKRSAKTAPFYYINTINKNKREYYAQLYYFTNRSAFIKAANAQLPFPKHNHFPLWLPLQLTSIIRCLHRTHQAPLNKRFTSRGPTLIIIDLFCFNLPLLAKLLVVGLLLCEISVGEAAQVGSSFGCWWLLLLIAFKGTLGRRNQFTVEKGSTCLGFLFAGRRETLDRKSKKWEFRRGREYFFCEEGAWVSFGEKGLFVGMWEFLARGVNILFYIGHLFIISICVPIKRREEESLL